MASRRVKKRERTGALPYERTKFIIPPNPRGGASAEAGFPIGSEMTRRQSNIFQKRRHARFWGVSPDGLSRLYRSRAVNGVVTRSQPKITRSFNRLTYPCNRLIVRPIHRQVRDLTARVSPVEVSVRDLTRRVTPVEVLVRPLRRQVSWPIR